MHPYWTATQARSAGVIVTSGLTPFNIATMLVTGYGESHMAEQYMLTKAIECEGELTDHVYFEMSFKHGYIGPRPISRLTRWVNQKKFHRMEHLWLPRLHGVFADIKFHAALTDAGKGDKWDGISEPHGMTSYARWQLLTLFGHERWGWPIPDGPKHTTCSEQTARRIYPEYDMRECGESFDCVTPGGGWALLKAQVNT